MKKLIILIIAVILVGISIYTVNTYNMSNAKNKANLIVKDTNNGKTTENIVKVKAIDFKLKDLDGKELSLSDLIGKKIFLNFWATWCPPCKSEMPEIEKLYQETKDSDLIIVAVEIGEPLSTVKPFINNNKYNFKVLLDTDQSVASKYGISAIPASYFIDKSGNIVSKNLGAINLEQMKASIKALDK